MVSKIRTVSFTVEGRSWAPTTPDGAPNSNGARPLGAAYAGTFIAHVPTLDESWGTIPLRLAARTQREGVRDPGGVLMPGFFYNLARAWLDTLCDTVPEWYEPVRDNTAEDDPELYGAVIVAWRALEEALEERKKKSPPTSDTTSPPT
jgi:hypothetical protein